MYARKQLKLQKINTEVLKKKGPSISVDSFDENNASKTTLSISSRITEE